MKSEFERQSDNMAWFFNTYCEKGNTKGNVFVCVLIKTQFLSETLGVQCGKDGVEGRKSGPIAYRATPGRLT